MIRSSWRPRLRSVLLASILLGAMGGALNSYVAFAEEAVCKDFTNSEGTCYTFGCFSGQCEYYGPHCGHGPSCTSSPD